MKRARETIITKYDCNRYFYSKKSPFILILERHHSPLVIFKQIKPTLSLIIFLFSKHSGYSEAPDFNKIKPDLVIPKIESGPVVAGKRIKQILPSYEQTSVYHVVYLPNDWQPDKSYPLLVEYAGNKYSGANGDISSGRPEGSKMGYGISAGQGFIWVCLPYLNASGSKISLTWWGDSKNRTIKPTIDYCLKAIPWICNKYGGDPKKVILCGFSRGAIACNYLGLKNDQIAKLWRAFIAYSHYDGIAPWPYPQSERKAALERLERLGTRQQFICHEITESKLNLAATKRMLNATSKKKQFTFAETGFRNHDDAWLLRPSSARKKLRQWLESEIQQ